MIDLQASPERCIAAALGIQGWSHLDAVLLAALATEAPVLLVGRHGTAKSLLVERLAHALQLSMRHYNASLMNYDDLVGIPLPTEDGASLRFVTTPGAIWDAEFVFFDEISRCRPDLQNKLFPIIHERRVNGIRLNPLRYRWAAMNPPAPEDADPADGQYYLGSEPLDPALADRFPFVVLVPTWDQLNRDDQRRLIAWQDNGGDWQRQPEQLHELVQACRANIPVVEAEIADWLAEYIPQVADLLAQARLPQSSRRIRMLARSLAAIHAARMALEGDDADLEQSAEIAISYGLPETASERPPSEATILAAHRQAWEIALLDEDDGMRQVFKEVDPIKRVLLADELDIDDSHLARLVTQALGAQTSETRRLGLATAMFLAFRERRQLTSAAWEPLVQLAVQVLEPRQKTVQIQGNQQQLWDAIQQWIDGLNDKADPATRLAINFVLAGFPDAWSQDNWLNALRRFQADLELFAIWQEANT